MIQAREDGRASHEVILGKMLEMAAQHGCDAVQILDRTEDGSSAAACIVLGEDSTLAVAPAP